MFAKNLKYLREKNHMEQLDLAKELGRKSASSISAVSELCHSKIKRATNVDITTFIAQCMETAGVNYISYV